MLIVFNLFNGVLREYAACVQREEKPTISPTIIRFQARPCVAQR